MPDCYDGKCTLMLFLAITFAAECLFTCIISTDLYGHYARLDSYLKSTTCVVKNITYDSFNITDPEPSSYKYTTIIETDYTVQYFLTDSKEIINGHIYEHKSSSDRYQVNGVYKCYYVITNINLLQWDHHHIHQYLAISITSWFLFFGAIIAPLVYDRAHHFKCFKLWYSCCCDDN